MTIEMSVLRPENERKISQSKRRPLCCEEEMFYDREGKFFECFECGAIIELQENILMCCGQKMVLADDHGTASCKICGKVKDIIG